MIPKEGAQSAPFNRAKGGWITRQISSRRSVATVAVLTFSLTGLTAVALLDKESKNSPVLKRPSGIPGGISIEIPNLL